MPDLDTHWLPIANDLRDYFNETLSDVYADVGSVYDGEKYPAIGIIRDGEANINPAMGAMRKSDGTCTLLLEFVARNRSGKIIDGYSDLYNLEVKAFTALAEWQIKASSRLGLNLTVNVVTVLADLEPVIPIFGSIATVVINWRK